MTPAPKTESGQSATAPGSAALTPAQAAPSRIGVTPRKLVVPRPLPDPSMGTMRYQTPLRYPGAKSGLARHIGQLVASASKSLGAPKLFVEPFAGGASTSLRLAGEQHVTRVLLADADPLVAAFWQTAAAYTDWLIDRMWDEPVTLDRWDYWRSYRPRAPREAAVKCLFLNRTTFSGILHGRAGPIGGRSQQGNYKIDCRFNKTALARRLRYVGDLYRTGRLVDVWCKDWEATLGDVAEWYPELLPDRVIAYLDPPYIRKSHKLYGCSFDPAGGYAPRRRKLDLSGWNRGREHFHLAEYLRCRAQYRWILSYDNHRLLTTHRGLYAYRRMTPSAEERKGLGVRAWYISRRLVSLRYTVSGSGRNEPAEELLLTTLPPSCVPADEPFRLVH